MLFGSSEHKVESVLDLLGRHLDGIVEKKSYKNSGAFYLAEISGSPVVWGMSRHSF
jgi:hypothetical protein